MVKKEPAQKVGYYPQYKMSEAELRDQAARLNGGQPPKPQKRPAERKGQKGWKPRLRLLAMLGCAAVFLASAGLLVNYYTQIYRAKDATAQLRELYEAPVETPLPDAHGDDQEAVVDAQDEVEEQHAEITATATPEAPSAVNPSAAAAATADPEAAFSDKWPSSYPDNPQLRIDESFQTLRRQNRDIVGWLTIDGVVDEPVLQKDNAYYLTHDSTGAKNVTGALFLDESCNLRTLSNNLIIHGHNMKEGAMFGALKRYKLSDASFYKAHPYLTFNTLYEQAKYVIFAVAEISVKSAGIHYIPFWQYVDFWDQSDFDGYVGRLKEYSHFQTKVDVQPGDRLVTLATCSGADDSARLLVVARKLRDGEDTIALNQGILSTIAK